MTAKSPNASARRGNKKTRSKRPRLLPSQLKAKDLDEITKRRCLMLLNVLSGRVPVTDAIAAGKISRGTYYQLEAKAIAAMMAAVSPTASDGGPALVQSKQLEELQQKVRKLEERVKELEQDNERLQIEAHRNEQLVQGLTQTLREVSSTTRTPRRTRTSKTTAKTSGGDDDGEAHRRALLERSEELVTRGLNRRLAAIAVRRDPATLRRWRARRDEGRALAGRRGPAMRPRIDARVHARVADVIRRTRGLVGADALRRIEPVSRREAAAIKLETVQAMERERVAAAVRVRVAAPGLIRGLDQLWVPTPERMQCVLALADAAIPYRTTIAQIDRYDGAHVEAVLAKDIEVHGAPLVLRLDRAKAHQVAGVQSLCAAHGVLVLHGPPRCPRYYGQLERQNAEHRAWLDAAPPLDPAELDEHLGHMQTALNALWPRRTLGWSTPEVMWNRRRTPAVDRAALRERVSARASRLAKELPPKAIALGTHHRLAIEHELVSLGLLELQPGGWC